MIYLSPITFNGKHPNVPRITIGNRDDNQSQALPIRTPVLSDTQIAELHWVDSDAHGQVITLNSEVAGDYLWEVTEADTRRKTNLTCWIEIRGSDNNMLWVSDTFIAIVGQRIEQNLMIADRYPDKLQQVMDDVKELQDSALDTEDVQTIVDEYLEANPPESGIVTEQDPTVPAWAKAPTKPTYTAAEVNADPSGTATTRVAEHNVDTDSHNDIRLELEALSERLNAFFDSDDATLDELSEIVAYITSNKSLIDAITTSKVNVSDIVNNLTTNVSNKPLSAAQGVELKSLINALTTGKLDASKLTESINTALAQAKESGEFDGKDGADGYTPQKGVDYFDGQPGKDGQDGSPGTPGKDGQNGQRGTGILKITTSTTSASGTGANGADIKYKVALSDVTSEAGVDEVLIGDVVLRSYYLYPVVNVDASYVYLGAYTSIRGATGTAGKDGEDGTDGVTPTVTISSGQETDGRGNVTIKVSTTDENGITLTSEGKVVDGKDGVTPVIAPDGNWYIGGVDTGVGAAGKTPVKGTDYWTEADKAEIVATVIESLGGNPVFGYVDSDTMTIVLKNAPDGEYSLAYLKDDGTVSAPIGSMVKDTNVYYTVTSNLTNCTSNGASQAIGGQSYTATITANSGYELSGVTVTMDGTDVTADVYSGGAISIAEVTGDIVVTAVAEEVKTNGGNLADPTSSDWMTDTRLATSYGYGKAADGMIFTNYIPAKMGDILRVKGLNLLGAVGSNSSSVAIYKSTDTSADSNGRLTAYQDYAVTSATTNVSPGDGAKEQVTVSGDVYSYTILLHGDGTQLAHSDTSYIRITAPLTTGYTAEDVIITINEEITA